MSQTDRRNTGGTFVILKSFEIVSHLTGKKFRKFFWVFHPLLLKKLLPKLFRYRSRSRNRFVSKSRIRGRVTVQRGSLVWPSKPGESWWKLHECWGGWLLWKPTSSGSNFIVTVIVVAVAVAVVVVVVVVNVVFELKATLRYLWNRSKEIRCDRLQGPFNEWVQPTDLSSVPATQQVYSQKLFYKGGTFPPSFSLFFSFLFKCTICRWKFALVGIQTTDLWCRKRPLNQLP